MRRGLRGYTKRNLKRSPFALFFSGLSITNWIVLINIIMFFVFSVLFAVNEDSFRYVALSSSISDLLKAPWTLITHMFMHAGFGHLFVNMVSLFFIGNFAEKIVGRKRFFTYYFISGLVAALFFILSAPLFTNEITLAVGASGALFGIGGLLAVLTPKLRVLVFFIIPMPMWLAMVVLMFGLWAISISLGLPIGNTAHLGGLIAGLAFGFYLRKKYKRKTRMISKYFS